MQEPFKKIMITTKKETSIPVLAYILALAQFSAPFMFAGVGVTLPAMGKEFHASGVALGLVETIYLGAASAFLLPVGHFSDSTDKNLLFKVGSFIYAISTLAIGSLPSVTAIIGFRFIQGFSAALVMATSMAILTDIVPKERLGKAIGMNIGAVYLGLSAGPFIAGWITTQYGWRWVFYSTSIPLILSYVMVQMSLKSKWQIPKIPFDWTGTFLIVTSIFLLISGSALLGESVFGYLLCISGVIVGFFFFVIERQMAQPLLKISKIKGNSTLSAALAIQLLMYAGAFGITFLFSIYLQLVKGFSPQLAGQILVVSPIFMAIFAPICGRLADSHSPRKLASLGLCFSLISTFLATQITSDTELYFLVGILIFQGFGFAMFSSPNMAIIMNSVTPKEYGMASALSAQMRSLGMVLSMMIITIFMSIYIGEHMIDSHSIEFLSVMQYSFIIFTLLAGGGTYLSLMRFSKRAKPVSTQFNKKTKYIGH